VFSEYLVDNKAMIRTEQYKYIYTTGAHDLGLDYETGHGPPGVTHRLYDVVNDPMERHDLARSVQYSGVVRTLQLRMLERFLETDPRAKSLPPQLSLEQALAFFCEPPEEEHF
jgi:arylsulfatase A-like enzyme